MKARAQLIHSGKRRLVVGVDMIESSWLSNATIPRKATDGSKHLQRG